MTNTFSDVFQTAQSESLKSISEIQQALTDLRKIYAKLNPELPEDEWEMHSAGLKSVLSKILKGLPPSDSNTFATELQQAWQLHVKGHEIH